MKPDDPGPSSPKRKRRVTRACDQCHRTNTKCAPGPQPSRCLNCHEFGSTCTNNRPVLRRGPRAGSGRQASDEGARARRVRRKGDLGWTYEDLAPRETIAYLVDAYHSIVYPIFPLFHWPTISSRVMSHEYTRDQALFATTMAVCAIVSARLRDGAVHHDLHPPPAVPPSEAFAQAAVGAFPSTLSHAGGFEFARAKALLAILYIQYGNVLEHRTHLGEFVVLASNMDLHDESRWSREVGAIEWQERRRLFWSIYTLEIYSAITWGGIVRFRESQSNVIYPAEVDDEGITDNGVAFSSPSTHVSFMRGWNHTTDMYRMLEYLVDRVRSNKPSDPGAAPLDMLFKPQYPSSKDVLDRLDSMHALLPDVFKSVRAMTGDKQVDRYGFQAANIIVTAQTVKLVLAAAGNLGVEQRCAFAGELINGLASIPTAYIAAVSRPMLHHLASCGHLLGSVVNRPLSQWALLQVRGVLLAMSDLLSGLETALHFPADISNNLREHVTKIESYLASAARDAQRDQVYHTALPATGSPNTQTAPHAPVPYPPPVPFNPFEDGHLASTAWMPDDFTFELPQDHQVQLQSDLMAWPEMSGGLFDFDFGETSEAVGSDWLFSLPGATTN